MQVFLVFDLSASTVISVGGGWFQPWSRICSVGPSLRTGIILLWYGFPLFTLGHSVACRITDLIAQGPSYLYYSYSFGRQEKPTIVIRYS